MHSFQYERNIDGKRVRITNVAPIKDKKLWRHIINYVPLDERGGGQKLVAVRLLR